MAEDLTLVVGTGFKKGVIANAVRISGWKSVMVRRGIEHMPSSFDIELTELFPGDAARVTVQRGDSCQVLLGKDLVITGYIDRVIPAIDKASHSIRITGRSMSQDLVDCSAEWDGSQISGANALGVAQQLAQPYGISVSSLADPGPPIPKFNFSVGDTCYELIERICRFTGLLVYDLPDGSVVLAQVGKARAGSGFTEGENIQSGRTTFAGDQVYSEYDACLLSVNYYFDAGLRNAPVAKSIDPNVKRRRVKKWVCESGQAALDLRQKRADWECARRGGRSLQVWVRTDSWRDAAGTLWTPNTIAKVIAPSLKVSTDLCISEVTFRRNSIDGTTAELVLMPPAAFLPEPIVLLPVLITDQPPSTDPKL